MSLLKWLQKKTRYTMSSEHVFSPVEQEDPRTQESIKRTRKNFEDQQQQMQARSMKPHAFDCPDPFTCTKSPCFKWEPDKIVGEPEVVRIKTKAERLEESEPRCKKIRSYRRLLEKYGVSDES